MLMLQRTCATIERNIYIGINADVNRHVFACTRVLYHAEKNVRCAKRNTQLTFLAQIAISDRIKNRKDIMDIKIQSYNYVESHE